VKLEKNRELDTFYPLGYDFCIFIIQNPKSGLYTQNSYPKIPCDFNRLNKSHGNG
jgi:hypothetical protein